MYLALLDNEKRHLFLDLELYMAKIDGTFSEQEKRIIDAHCIEMHIDNNGYECENTLDELYTKLRINLTDKEKRIVFFELVGTIMADDVYHESEKEMVRKLSDILDIDKNDEEKVFDIIKDMKSVYERCSDFIK